MEDIIDITSVLDSETRLNILNILDDEMMSINDILEKYQNQHPKTRRETIYRAVEKLRSVDIVKRKYVEDDTCFKYKRTADKIEVDLKELETTVEPV